MNCVFGTNRQTIKDINFPSDFNSNATFSFAGKHLPSFDEGLTIVFKT